MKLPSTTVAVRRLAPAVFVSAALLAAAGLASAQVTQTEKKTEVRTGGIVQTSETKTTEAVLPQADLTTVEGTITRLEDGKILIRTKKAEQPIGFVLNPATKLVDLDGKPVAVPLLVSGVPVKLHYAEDHNTLVAANLQVQRVQVPLPDGTTTLTTRETLKPGGKIVQETSTTRTTIINGVLTTSETGRISVAVPGETNPVIYAADSTTVVLDAAGKPVAVDAIAPGTPLSIGYIKDANNRLIAREVTVVKAAPVAVPAGVPIPVPVPVAPAPR